MPSLTTLTGRPSPTAWPDPATMAEQPKSSDIRRSQWPFMVQGEEIVTDRQPSAKVGKLVADTPMAADLARRICDAKSHGPIDANRLVGDNLTATTLSVKSIDANTVAGVFPGALHANSVTAAWAMSNGLGHLVKKP
jgi:hypothetical protein